MWKVGRVFSGTCSPVAFMRGRDFLRKISDMGETAQILFSSLHLSRDNGCLVKFQVFLTWIVG